MNVFPKIIFSLFFCSISLNIVVAQYFQNPVLPGFYPDPSICRNGKDYYLTVSSFAYYPGLPVFHSKDLVHWKQIGAALNRPEQLNLDGAGVSRGLFAPTIRYHNGFYYIVCTLVDKGGNFIIRATDPKGPWTDPVWLPEINGIDPSLFFDQNDSAYIIYNSIPPENKSVYSGHRTIRMNQLDLKNLKVIGDNKILVNGGTDITKNPVWIEAPHIFKKDGFYYLICAEGGTGYNHSEVVFQSEQVEGPYLPFSGNPILTQRDLDKNRPNPITSAGHADFVETPEGNWWAVFLGCRPYTGDYYNTGRETFMAPVAWQNGWPIINPNQQQVQYQYPIGVKINRKKEQLNGNFLFKDDFNQPVLHNRYQFLRTVRKNWYTLQKGKLIMDLQPETCTGKMNPSFIGFRQSHLKGYAATEMDFQPNKENEKAGLLVFQNETHHYFLGKSVFAGKPVVELYQNDSLLTRLPLSNHKPIRLKIVSDGDTYSFYYRIKKHQWILVKNNLDAKFLSTQQAGGFVGCFYAMYASSNQLETNQKVQYNWFLSENQDNIYK